MKPAGFLALVLTLLLAFGSTRVESEVDPDWMDGAVAGTITSFDPLPALASTGVVLYQVYGQHGGDWSAWLAEHPETADNLPERSSGFLAGLLRLPIGGRALLRLFATAYPDEAPSMVPIGVEYGTAPQNMSQVVGDLAQRDNDQGRGYSVTARDNTTSNLDVRRLTGNGSAVSWIVNIPGTRRWSLHAGACANDLGANLHAMSGDTSALEQSIQLALIEAGVGIGEPVLLAGHSQGGLTALRAAEGLRDAGYSVTHVLAVGAPSGYAPVPRHVKVLSLVNEMDVVPRLAHRAVTGGVGEVRFSSQLGGVLANHRMTGPYRDAGPLLDSSTDPAVRAFRASAHAFTDRRDAEIRKYRVTRETGQVTKE
ncbi:hypothetical protein D5S17_13845 [Pseudonocardiaceae bacterium YIM PH 21723]|nr:hypothetical protein D5S17_13845 [Pseudonocardiaceae bacterium YIM PH 21723]